MRARRRLALGGLCALVAACGSGRSILETGIESTTTVSTLPGETTLPPTTLPTLLDTLPPCNPDALDDAAASGPVDITFWHGLSNELGRELERQTALFNSSQNRVRVTLQFQDSYELTIDKYLQSNPENRPDMVQTPEYALQVMIDTESTVPVQACMEADGYDTSTFLPAVLNAYATEGVQWTLPYNVSNPVLFYNKKVFAAAGLDPERPPLTLADVSEYGRQIQSSGAAAYGLAVDTPPDGGGGWFLEQWLGKEGALYSNNDNGRSAPSTEVAWNSDAGVAIATELSAVVNEGGGIFVGENPSGQDSLLKLADAERPAAMAITTSAALGPVLGFIDGGIIPGFTRADLGIGPLPSPSGKPGATVGGASLWIVDGKGDAKAAAVWEYMQFLVSAQAQSEWAAATGYVPVRTDSLDLEPIKSLYINDPRFKVAYDQLLAAPTGPAAAGPVLGPLREIRVIAADALTDILNGADPKARLDEGARLANLLITEYNSQ
jgi:sn-glycerol 3-phosphate transport system substrate-binding protein